MLRWPAVAATVVLVLAPAACASGRPNSYNAPAPSLSAPAPAGSAGDQPAPPLSRVPQPPARSTLIAFTLLGTRDGGPAPAEVTQSGAIEPFLLGPPAQMQKVRDAVDANRTPGTRIFAFALNGCMNTGASLVIGPDRMYAQLTGGVGAECFAAQLFLAVFAVGSNAVPSPLRLGR
ncbi:MAG: hypothetical protein J2P15_00660 [Micromonosporaceae bacterium]|nr:hypothetical protein [Micromonosporaceae bacterium]